jgi:hypothetical protein
VGTPEDLMTRDQVDAMLGLVKEFNDVRESLSRLRTMRLLAGHGPFWWERMHNDWSSVATLSVNTALHVPAVLLVADLGKLFGLVNQRAPEAMTLWFRDWKQPNGYVHLSILPEGGGSLTIEPGKLLNGIIDGTISLDWHSELAWRAEALRLAETEGLFPGLCAKP